MIGSELISASDMLIRNIPTLQGQTLCEYLQTMDNEENKIKIKDEEEIQKHNSFSIKIGLISWLVWKILFLYFNYRDYKNSLYISAPGHYKVYREDNPEYFEQRYKAEKSYCQSTLSTRDIMEKLGFTSISSIVVGTVFFLVSGKVYEKNMSSEAIWDKKKIIAIRADRIEIKIRAISERMTNLSIDRKTNSSEIEQLQRVKDFFQRRLSMSGQTIYHTNI